MKTIRVPLLLITAAMLLPCACSKKAYNDADASASRSQKMWRRVGSELATLTSKQVKDGGRILLICASTNAAVSADQDVIRASFLDRVKAAETDVDVVRVPDARRTPEQVAALMPALPMPLKAAWLAGAMGEHQPAAAVVSLVGEPDMVPSGGACPPIVCFAPSADAAHLKQLFDSGAVVGAVTQRHSDPGSGEKDWFELRYTVVDKDTVGSW